MTAPTAHDAAQPLVRVEGLTVDFATEDGRFTAVDDLDFVITAGETLAIVGESGSGKSVTSLALMRLIEFGGGRIAKGRLLFRGRDGRESDLATRSVEAMTEVRGNDIAMIFQEPMTSLNPIFTIGEQIAEVVRLHRGASRVEARAEALAMLEKVRIPDAARLLDRHPHQLSGGMRQRVMIAMALACRPKLLIADEPTTALDVTIQAQILRLVRALQDEMEMAVMFITHDMGVVAEVADRVLVMRYGRKVEEGAVEEIFAAPKHPYTKALLAAVPRLGALTGQALPRRFPLLSTGDTVEVVSEAAPQDTVKPGEPVLEVAPTRPPASTCATQFLRPASQAAPTRSSISAFAMQSPAKPWRLVGESGLRQIHGRAQHHPAWSEPDERLEIRLRGRRRHPARSAPPNGRGMRRRDAVRVPGSRSPRSTRS